MIMKFSDGSGKSGGKKYTVMCLSTGTPKSNKFSICFKCKINYF